MIGRTRIASVVVSLTCLAAALAPAATIGAAPAPGEPVLDNLEHVYNFAFPDGSEIEQASDIEFYTSTVPQRDENGEKVLDGNGEPILAERDFAVVGSYGRAEDKRGAFIFDITNPEEPRFAVLVECNQLQNDVQVKKFGDRWLLALALDDGLGSMCITAPRFGQGAAGISVFDVTDPYEYQPLYSFRYGDGAHNFTFHPTKPFGWISSGDLPGLRDGFPTIDFTNPTAPAQRAFISTVGGPHDIVFDKSGDLAFVATENHVRIFDSSNPANPQLLGLAVAPTSYHHDATPSPDGKLMVVTGESLALGGFFTPFAVCPGEGLSVFSIEGPLVRAPVMLSEFFADVTGLWQGGERFACTAHVGRFTANSRYYVMGWYAGGVRVVDLADPRQPKEAGAAVMPGAEVWAAKPYKGPYVYVADQRRGFDVFRWTGPSFEE